MIGEQVRRRRCMHASRAQHSMHGAKCRSFPRYLATRSRQTFGAAAHHCMHRATAKARRLAVWSSEARSASTQPLSTPNLALTSAASSGTHMFGLSSSVMR